MTTTMPAAPSAAKKPQNKPCQCGCDCHCDQGECCELECLVHPRFFCGQLLADQDLTALVEWIKNKTGLSRFRHGWGIVCGLDVHCGAHGAVTISPGYAMDCCGRDVVLCKETTFDLGGCWEYPPSPCSDLNRSRRPGSAESKQQPIPFAGFSAPPEQVQVFDILLRYAESQSDARNALVRGGCGGQSGCEYTRVHETYKIYCRPANGCDDPNGSLATEWLKEYRNELLQLLKEVSAWRENDSTNALQRLSDYLSRHSLSTFCFLREWVCDLVRKRENNELSEGWMADLVFWLIMDWRNARFRTPCTGCGPDTGILLARAWLWRRLDSRGNELFSTLYINSYSPFRRPLGQDQWPAPAGSINLARYIWNDADGATAALKALGFNVTPQNINPPSLPDQLRNESLFANSALNPELALYYYPDLCGRKRVICFGGGQTNDDRPQDLPPDHPTLRLDEITGIGETISAKLKAKNINNILDLAKAKPEDVRAALADVRPARDETQLIKLAQERVAALEQDPGNQ